MELAERRAARAAGHRSVGREVAQARAPKLLPSATRLAAEGPSGVPVARAEAPFVERAAPQPDLPPPIAGVSAMGMEWLFGDAEAAAAQAVAAPEALRK